MKTQLKQVLPSLLFLTAMTGCAYVLSRRENELLSGLCLILAAGELYLDSARREQNLMPLPGLFALGLIGGEGVSALHLSHLGTVWTAQTWLSFFLGYLCFYLCYHVLLFSMEHRRTVQAGKGEQTMDPEAERKSEKGRREKRIRCLWGILLFLLTLPTVCFLYEAKKLGFIPFFTVDTPHAYSTFHLPGIHYFTTLTVLAPSAAVLYMQEKWRGNGQLHAGDRGNRLGEMMKRADPWFVMGLFLPWCLTILMVSRFQFLFSVILMLFTAVLNGFPLKKKQLMIILPAMILVYGILTVARAHSVTYLNGIFEMKNENMPIFITQPYMYIANNYDNFNVMTEQLTEHSRGMKMLYPFVTLSGLKYFVDLPLAYPLYVTKEELTTVTLLYDSWYDFGLPGVLGFTAVLGLLSALVSDWNRRNGTPIARKKNPMAALITAQLCFYLCFSFFTTWFSNPATIFYLGFSVLFFIIVHWAGK